MRAIVITFKQQSEHTLSVVPKTNFSTNFDFIFIHQSTLYVDTVHVIQLYIIVNKCKDVIFNVAPTL